MRARGQGALAVVLVGVVALLAVGADRLGPKAPAAAREGVAGSGMWLCPHGGGPDWEASVYLANPGETEVRARVTATASARPEPAEDVVVPPGGQVRVRIPAEDRGAASYVEYFDGWISAGWITRGQSGEPGIGAEPCAPVAGRSWASAGLSTRKGERAFLIVMNPFAIDAVFDVALFFAPPRTPVRDSALTDVTLRPGRSLAIKLNAFAEGEAAMGLGIDVTSGRIAAATQVVASGRGIASVLASPAEVDRAYLPTPAGGERAVLSLATLGSRGSHVGALVLSEGAARPVPNLASGSVDPVSASVFPVTPRRPASVDVAVQEGAPIVAALRTRGRTNDDGATGGSPAPAGAWVVAPTAVGEPAKPSLLVVNPGDAPVTVMVRLLPLDAGTAAETTLTVPAASVAAVPARFLAGDPGASALVTAEDGAVIALGGSSSLGSRGDRLFGLSAGVPIPDRYRPPSGG